MKAGRGWWDGYVAWLRGADVIGLLRLKADQAARLAKARIKRGST